MDFSLERIRTLEPNSDDEQYLLEISWLYNRIVLSGSQIPVIDLAYELVLSEEFVGECVTYSMELGFLTNQSAEHSADALRQKRCAS